LPTNSWALRLDEIEAENYRDFKNTRNHLFGFGADAGIASQQMKSFFVSFCSQQEEAFLH
jgi:hypothetical protein